MSSYQLISENIGTIFDNPGVIFRCPIINEQPVSYSAVNELISITYNASSSKNTVYEYRGKKRVPNVLGDNELFSIPVSNNSTFLIRGELSARAIPENAFPNDSLVSHIDHRVCISSAGVVNINDGFSYTFAGLNEVSIRPRVPGDGLLHLVLWNHTGNWTFEVTYSLYIIKAVSV